MTRFWLALQIWRGGMPFRSLTAFQAWRRSWTLAGEYLLKRKKR